MVAFSAEKFPAEEDPALVVTGSRYKFSDLSRCHSFLARHNSTLTIISLPSSNYKYQSFKMHPATIVLTLFATLTLGSSQKIVVYSDDACATQITTFDSSMGSENSCQSLPSGIGSYEVTNDAHNCEAASGMTEYNLYSNTGCSGNAVISTCYVGCTAVGDVTLGSWLWQTASDPVDPPRI